MLNVLYPAVACVMSIQIFQKLSCTPYVFGSVLACVQLGLLTEKSKVVRFQIYCARTKNLSEIYKNRTIIVGATKLISPKIGHSLVQVTSEALLLN